MAYERLDPARRTPRCERCSKVGGGKRYPGDARLALPPELALRARLHERSRAEELLTEALRLANGLSAAERKSVNDEVTESRRQLTETR